METKLCRICGKLGENYVHIFKTEGLKNKIETCLPIVVSQYCLLPDTICSECLENVENFYSFIKNCLQNIIVLEAQYDITESCLKTKRKHEKSCLADITLANHDKNIQTDDEEFNNYNYNVVDLSQLDKIDVALSNINNILKGKDVKNIPKSNIKREPKVSLVNYENETDSNSEEDGDYRSTISLFSNDKIVSDRSEIVNPDLINPNCLNAFNSNLTVLKNYFDDKENSIIDEIVQRKKRKAEESIGSAQTKIFKMDTNNKRKCKNPKKVDTNNLQTSKDLAVELNQNKNFQYPQEQLFHNEESVEENKTISTLMPQICLLCDEQYPSASALMTHVYESHGIDMAKVIASCPVAEDKKKRIPNLVKITDLKNKEQACKTSTVTEQCEDAPQLRSFFICSFCSIKHDSKSDFISHLQTQHPDQMSLTCNLCFYNANTYNNLIEHLEICKETHNIASKYICKVCCYHDDNVKIVENHIPIHDFILKFCKRQLQNFDPSDYIEINSLLDTNTLKSYACSMCEIEPFASFKDFSLHCRNSHQVFHCDLCNKSYGRNSHLWKHVKRLHSGHPSITCQLCNKTSATKHYLAIHFNKIHVAKTYEENKEDFMKKKFDGFDFQYVKQSFMRQELKDKEQRKNTRKESEESWHNYYEESKKYNPQDCKSKNNLESITKLIAHKEKSKILEVETDEEVVKMEPPKEIDASSDLYTNIITNYTPPKNEGANKCPKCFRCFHKKALLKKHKKNCRPRLQKDLLTRCKSCSRIFKDRQSLTKHLINYHSEYNCEICDQKVQSKCEIVSHIRFSHPNCHLFCSSCSNILRSKNDLIEHKKDHRNSFVCQFCGDMLPTKIKLKMHILSLHRKILSLSCGICLKLFETQHILRDHVQLVHKSNLSPLTSCTVCGKNYGSKWKTYDHLNKSHGRIFKACKMCLEVFDTEDDLRTHYDCSHANNAKIITVQNAEVIKNNHKNEKNFSDFDEQEVNDSSSEVSNDMEEYHSNYVTLTDIPMQDEKISLLEKRLLGSTIKKITKSNDSASSSKEENNDNGSQPFFSSSSKRTVYVNSNDPSVCEICQKIWPAKKHLWQHYIRCHKRVAATVCGICLKTNDSYETLQAHLVATHPNLLYGQGFGSNFICRICGRYHNASSKLKLHMAIHDNFDWALLDQICPETTPEKLDENMSLNNGVKGDEVEEIDDEEEEEMNYESLIEQVEVDVDTESESDGEMKEENYVETTSDESYNYTDTNAKEDCHLENDMATGPFENLQKFYYETTTNHHKKNALIKKEFSSSDNSDESSDSVQSDSSVSRCSNPIKNDELDSAIRSITYDQLQGVKEEMDEDECDLQSHATLNQTEIQSAVDSIL